MTVTDCHQALERHLRQPAAEAGQVTRPEESDHQDDT